MLKLRLFSLSMMIALWFVGCSGDSIEDPQATPVVEEVGIGPPDSLHVDNNPDAEHPPTNEDSDDRPSYEGLAGGALSLDGDGDYAEVADKPSLHSDRTISITCWFRLDEATESWRPIFGKGNVRLNLSDQAENSEYSLWHNLAGSLHTISTPTDRIGVGQLASDYTACSLGYPSLQ